MDELEIKKRIEVVQYLTRRVSDGISVASGQCYSGSFSLGIRLATNGIYPTLVKGKFFCNNEWHRHFWLDIKYLNIIADVSVGQFDEQPQYYVGPPTSSYKAIKYHQPDFHNIALWLGFDVYEFGSSGRVLWQAIDKKPALGV